jgi:hypothetical protein
MEKLVNSLVMSMVMVFMSVMGVVEVVPACHVLVP